ncbi:MAG: SPFH domain-containing protein [Myxococcales bacterium]|nr:SPFH domain-containing protein [Myxococcales bacterium]
MTEELGELLGVVVGVGFIPGLILLILILRGFFVVEPRVAFVVLYWGKYRRSIVQPGIHWAFPIGLGWRRVSLRDAIAEIPLTTIVDTHGNPIQASAVCVFHVVDPVKATLDVQDYRTFVNNQASTVLKAVCSRFPYESENPNQPCLKKESAEIIHALASQLRGQVQAAGVDIRLIRLNDLAYAPEIAQSMLLRQQAQALVDARRTLVEGALDTVKDALETLARLGIVLPEPSRNFLASNLTLLLCAGERGEQHSTVVTRQR